MSELSGSIRNINSTQRERLEKGLVAEYQQKCASQALVSIAQTGIVPQYKDIKPHQADDRDEHRASRGEITQKFEVTPESVIGFFDWTRFSQSSSPLYRDFEEMLSAEISKYMNTLGKDPFGDKDGNQYLELMKRTTDGDCLYNLFEHPDNERLESNLIQYEDRFMEELKPLYIRSSQSNNSVFGSFYGENNISYWYRLIETRNLPEGCTELDETLLQKQLNTL